MLELLHALNLLSPDDDVVTDQVVDQSVRHAPQDLGLFQDARHSKLIDFHILALCSLESSFFAF